MVVGSEGSSLVSVGAFGIDGVACEALWAGARCGKASWKSSLELGCEGVEEGAGSERMGIEVGVGCCGSALLSDDVHSQPILTVCESFGVRNPVQTVSRAGLYVLMRRCSKLRRVGAQLLAQIRC